MIISARDAAHLPGIPKSAELFQEWRSEVDMCIRARAHARHTDCVVALWIEGLTGALLVKQRQRLHGELESKGYTVAWAPDKMKMAHVYVMYVMISWAVE